MVLYEVTTTGTTANLCEACAAKRPKQPKPLRDADRGARCRDCGKSEGDIAFEQYNADQHQRY